MGICYYLFNHRDATYYELGKGPWHNLNYEKDVLYDPDLMVLFLNEEWSNFQDNGSEESLRYYRMLGEDLKRFVDGAPPESLYAVGDSGDEHYWGHTLKYRCNGIRYNLDNPGKNAAAVKENNDRHEELAGAYHMGEGQIDELVEAGWNATRLRGPAPAKPTRYELALKGATP